MMPALGAMTTIRWPVICRAIPVSSHSLIQVERSVQLPAVTGKNYDLWATNSLRAGDDLWL
ncbi:MAG: hypothetical protein EBR92_02215 [Alphaproteobacteria bacterium]|nr:hypothetical protein [Alphaproteobacteria bacterium]